MTCKQPTEAQIKEFWEWCGFECYSTALEDLWFRMPGDESYKLLPIDLNNLFKYAVPKLDGFKLFAQAECPDMVFAEARTVNRYFKAGDKDPALALFWAIWEAKKK